MIKIKYQVLNKGYELISEDELLDILLKNRGVDNPKKLLKVNKLNTHDGMLLRNMDRGLNMLHWHIENNSKIHIIYDVDVDGVTSGTEIEDYILKVNSNIIVTHSMNENKVHGIVLKNLEEYDFDLLIVPDAGSSDAKQCKELTETRDVDILILDHHDIEVDNPYAIVINCKDGQYPNNTLSGAGVVYKFLKEYDKKYGYHFADDNLDLVAIGMVSDSMDLRNYETRYLSIEGLKNIQNSFMRQFIIKNKKDDDEINFEFVGWKIAPSINAVTRIGSKAERLDLIDAFLGKNETKEYQPRRKRKSDPKPDIVIQTLQECMVRESANIKAKQDKLVTKSMNELIEIIDSKNLYKNKVIIVNASDILEKSFTGLVANKIANIYKRPVIILKHYKSIENETIYGGSFRNYDLFPIVSFKDVLKEIGTFDKLAGHENAGGFKIKESKLQETVSKLNELFKDINIEDVYLVDYEIPVGRLKEKHVIQVGQWADIWGNTLKKPRFAVTDITLNIEDIQLLGDKRNFIKFDKIIGKNKITFVKKFANEEIYNKMIMKTHKGLSKMKSNKIKMDVIGEFVINKWNESEYPQVEIVDFNVSQAKEFRF
jgi:single-stranded-DNA-specific exonuclease